ncbi:MAG: LptF/LptG family permease [Prevotella sp.]|nr:LptF/LptG family permease [Prevotella sp.]MDD7461355.1 LptF/LptG family permease [Prevotellaceae bacterium]MDY3365780.1 LptF/LptG family permease [Prevotella sp.]
MFRIKKLDIFILRQFGMLFIGTFFICQFVLMMQFLWRQIDDIIGKGVPMEILAQFFWHMGLMLVPQALPLAILLSSLITFGNMGESCELTAIKAAGISLMQAFRSLVIAVIFISLGSFYFQNFIGPQANVKLAQLFISMKQKSPELGIPEGMFYDGIPNSNIYVEKKDIETGKLYGVMIYRMSGSYEDAEIILADSAMLQSTADKKHLLLTLWAGEWFGNMTQQMTSSAAVPYRRETFLHKTLLIDFNADFNMTDASLFSSDPRGKSLAKIAIDIDSINNNYDSIGRSFYRDAEVIHFRTANIDRNDSLEAVRLVAKNDIQIDTLYSKLNSETKADVISNMRNQVQSMISELEFKAMLTNDGERELRMHKIEAINKFTVALSCLIFFFIGAPLGAIIRKGGLGIPVIVSVLVFITYYILENTGYRMARGGMWPIWFGKGLSVGVLTPLAVFVTYKANKDSVVFNMDAYKAFFNKVLALRVKRHIAAKEVIIQDPDYLKDREILNRINQQIQQYEQVHRLTKAPNPISIFFKYQPDHQIEEIYEDLEAAIADMSNTRDKVIITALSKYPIIITKAHTRPFERKWLNMLVAFIVPLALFFYIRMWLFRVRLYRDIKSIYQTNQVIVRRIDEKYNDAGKDSE